MRKLLLVAAILFSAANIAHAADARLMTDAQYKTFLSQTDAILPRLERALNRFTKQEGPGVGTVGVTEIHAIHWQFCDPRSHSKRTLSDELDLRDYMKNLSINLTLAHIDAPELTQQLFLLNDEVIARVALRKDL